MKVEKIDSFNWESALRGMRNPLESWDKADSTFTPVKLFEIGKNDYILAKKLILAGSDHRKFLRQIFVSCDVTAPDYFWKETSTYKVGTVENSTSTMHRIMSKPFNIDMFEVDYKSGIFMINIIRTLNSLRDAYIERKQNNENEKMLEIWRAIIQILPMSWLYTRTISLNYEVLTNMYKSRYNHKLVEWRIFLDALITELPYPEFFTHKFKE